MRLSAEPNCAIDLWSDVVVVFSLTEANLASAFRSWKERSSIPQNALLLCGVLSKCQVTFKIISDYFFKVMGGLVVDM